MIQQIVITQLVAFTLLWVIFRLTGRIRIIDLYWGVGFIIHAYFAIPSIAHLSFEQMILLAAIGIWALRITLLMVKRHFTHHKEDPRYLAILNASGPYKKIVVLFTVFWTQGFIQSLLSIPLIIGFALTEKDHIPALVYGGLCIVIIGFMVELIADYQMEMFKHKHKKNELCDQGLWRISRHPNYLGETILWWGIGFISYGITLNSLVFFSPILLNVLIRYYTGIPLMEAQLLKTKLGYAEYQKRTPVFLPNWFKLHKPHTQN